MTSDSSFVSSTIRFVKPLFTKTLFQPVTASIFVSFFSQTLGGNKGMLTVGANHGMHCLEIRALVQL